MRTPVAYLASYLLSVLGNAIAAVAFPLIVLDVTGSALGAGIVAASTAVPAIVAGMFMGVVIDRINKRTSSVLTDLISAACVAALPVVDMIWGLALGWFILFGILGSLGDVPGLTARDALLPAIVRSGSLTSERLVGLRESFGAVALLLGPALAGTLMAVFGGSTLLWVTAATSAAAAVCTLLIPRPVGEVASAGTRAGGAWAELRAGWRVLARSRFLVATTMLGVAAVVVLTGFQGLVLPVYFTMVDEPGMLGFVLTALAAGSLLGGGVYAAAGARGRRAIWLVAGLVGTTAGFAVIAGLASIAAVFGGAVLVGVANGVFGSLIGVLMIERIPEAMRGRIMGTQNAIMTAAPTVGIVVAALVTEYGSVEAAAVVVPLVWLIGVALFTRPVLRNLEADEQRPIAHEAVTIDAQR
ncbi:MFS transporter [Gordonia sp. NPDC127522]|uniref:MFS transporter n=1 Tax=Gordonia sp. NPDC127522 TaxID=3345390 RepID=UPI0036289753